MNYSRYYTQASECVAQVFPTHPSVDEAIKNGTQFPNGHIETDPLLRPYMPNDHRNTDELLKNGTKIPLGHPNIDPFLCFNLGCVVHVYAVHPSVDAAIQNGLQFPAEHVATDPYLRPYLPLGHRNTDELLKNGTKLPAGHPLIDPYLCYDLNYQSSGDDCVTVPYNHPLVHDTIAGGGKLPFGHRKVDSLLRPMLPSGHPNCDDLLDAGTSLPFGHPNIDDYLCSSSFYSPGILMSMIVMASFSAGILIRCSTHSLKFIYQRKTGDKGAQSIENAAAFNSAPNIVPVAIPRGKEPTVVGAADPLRKQALDTHSTFKEVSPITTAAVMESDWQEMYSEEYHAPYWFNKKTNVSSWAKPESPAVPASIASTATVEEWEWQEMYSDQYQLPYW